VRGSYPFNPTARSTASFSWQSAILTILGAGIVAVVALGIAQYIEDLPRPAFAGGRTIPQLVGTPLAAVHERAQQDGLSVLVLGERPSGRYPRGTVIQQSPVAGWSASEDSILRVTVSSGLAVPDVVGHTLAEARSKLSRLGWSLVAPVGTSADARVKLQYPEPGQPVDAPGELSLAFED
jgi:hypothetical protein